MGHGLGWIADVVDERDEAFSLSKLSLGEVKSSHSMRNFVVEMLNQGALPSCVAQAVPQGIRVVEYRKSGRVPPLTSRFFTWYYARLQHGDQNNATGTYIRTAVKVLNALGRPPEQQWPHVLTDVNIQPPRRPTYAKRPPPRVSMCAYDHRKVQYHRITETGTDRKYAVKAALSAGMPVVFGTDVGYSFLEDEGPARNIAPPIAESIAGGHAMLATGFDEEGVEDCNSWGTDWRDLGFAHLSWDYICWEGTRDLWAFSLPEAA